MKIIDTYKHTTEGYNPFLITGKWQVAFLNYAEAESLEQIEKLDIHYKTDEAFVLLKGQVILIGANIENDQVTYQLIDMEPNTVYNIRQNVWHKVAMSEGSQLLIMEDNNTHLGDFEFYHLTAAQKQDLTTAAGELLKKRKNT